MITVEASSSHIRPRRVNQVSPAFCRCPAADADKKTAGPAQRLMALLGKTGGLDSVRYIIQQVQAFYLPARCVLSDASQN